MPENGQENGVNGASAEKRKADDDVGNGDSGAKKEKLEAGTLLFSGATDWKQVGRKDTQKLLIIYSRRDFWELRKPNI